MTLAGGQLAAGMLGVDALLTAAQPRALTALFKFGEDVLHGNFVRAAGKCGESGRRVWAAGAGVKPRSNRSSASDQPQKPLDRRQFGLEPVEAGLGLGVLAPLLGLKGLVQRREAEGLAGVEPALDQRQRPAPASPAPMPAAESPVSAKSSWAQTACSSAISASAGCSTN